MLISIPWEVVHSTQGRLENHLVKDIIRVIEEERALDRYHTSNQNWQTNGLRKRTYIRGMIMKLE